MASFLCTTWRDTLSLAESAYGEHFHCAPEIIQFSNHLSYDGEIKPLRDTSGIGIKPSDVSCPVPNGLRLGDHNIQEALTGASLITAAVRFPEYADATFGAISLHGTTQAPMIDRLLRQNLPACLYEQRQSCAELRRTFKATSAP